MLIGKWLRRLAIGAATITVAALTACGNPDATHPPQYFEDWAVTNSGGIDTYAGYCAYVSNESVCKNAGADHNVKIVTDKKVNEISDGLTRHATLHLLNKFARGQYDTTSTEEKAALESAIRLNGDPSNENFEDDKNAVIKLWQDYSESRLKSPLPKPSASSSVI